MKVQTEQSKFDTDEHILVCLSSSPSNARIIHTAAKMAKVLHARFTAIYVQTDTVINDEDQSRLSQNIQLAQRLGAEIVMTHGENVALQISEYVRLSDVTKIVIGQSSARRRGLFGRPTLTEKLISSAPDVDIHIIPDALNYTKSHRRRLFFGAEIPSLRDIAVTVLALAVCTAIGFLFDHLDFPDTNIVTVYILGVLMISVLTKGYLCSMAGSLLSVVLFGFFLTEPRLSFQTYAVGYPVTFAVMLASSVLTGTLASKLKDHARLSARSAFRVQVLFDTDRLLQKAKSKQLRADLLRSISHDLRTPLCSVSGNADTLLHNGNCLDEATKQQIYKDIYDDSEWLIGVVENLLYVTRLNDGRLKLELTDQLVDEVVNEAVSHLKKKSVGHKVTVRCDDLILARMDAQLIVQVIVNLIDNALKYTEQGSEICVSAEKQGGDAVIRVTDNGNGIADDMKPHIFEMFYTGKNTVADSRRSFGIGLTLCKSIVELHGGTLTLTDNVPHGCIFTFTLPLSEVTLNE
jgi:K+-sensing histidine kinase KdpD